MNFKNLRCIFLNTYYPDFLDAHYSANPQLINADYLTQKSALQAQAFGDSDFYSEGMKAAGWLSDDLIVNCPPLMNAWARENNFNGQPWDLVLAQLSKLSPDVVYIQDMHMMSAEMLLSLRHSCKIIAGQNASPNFDIPPNHYDVLFSSYPYLVKKFKEAGFNSYLQPLAFDPRVLQGLPSYPYLQRPTQVSFVGGITQSHSDRLNWLSHLAEATPIEFWGYGAEKFPPDSPVRQRHRGQAWGKEMFSRIVASKITLNKQVTVKFGSDAVSSYATNMRLYEATGCGALLVTEHKENLCELFDIGKEIVSYRSNDECSALVRYYIRNPQEAEKIAAAGQARTLRDHTYRKRMEVTARILEEQLTLKK